MKTYKEQKNLHTMRCPVCSTLFFPKRSDALYCSSRCRVKAHRSGGRAKNEEQSYYAQIMSLVMELSALNQHRKLRVLAMQIIEQLPDDERAKLYDSLKEDEYRISVTDM